MFKTEDEIWESVVKLKGQTVSTLTHNKPNFIIDVENTGSPGDEIHIENRQTRPTRNDVVEAYKTLVFKGELDRKTDLSYLSGVSEQKSSIVFAIIFTIAGDDVELFMRNKRLIILLKK